MTTAWLDAAAADGLRAALRNKTVERSRPAEAGIAASVGSGPAYALVLAGVSLAFGGVSALDGISLTVRRGEICSIIGPNGAGKSSLINVVSGLYAADRGTINLLGKRVDKVRASHLARLGVARTFQNLALFGGLSVRDNVASGLVHKRRSNVFSQVLGLPGTAAENRRIRERAAETIDFLGLSAHGDQLVATLPYGLQKRVELARALVADPALLLLDEPMAGMTATEKSEMAGFVRAARAHHDLTVVLIEHDIGVVMGLSDHVVVLDYGRKIADGTPAAVRADPAVIRAYIGSTDGVGGEGI
ncbi:MAG: ABC transporter ATP-binding protein [Rhizobiaceae bacterium]|nr:ABC transporter ATP-binding protein [Rhizobiaceae bacterium]